MKIHREGRTFLTITFIVFAALCALFVFVLGLKGLWILLLLAPVFIFLLRFFREPSRTATVNSSKVISPADGQVVAIEEVEETEFLKTRCIQISVFMSVWNVHINWFPSPGMIVYYRYHPGKYLLAWNPKSSTLNERTTVGVQLDNETTILFRQIAGFMARRVVCYAAEGKQVEQCSQVGFIKFGSRVDVFVPLNSKLKVKLNDKVVGTQTILADLPSETAYQ